MLRIFPDVSQMAHTHMIGSVTGDWIGSKRVCALSVTRQNWFLRRGTRRKPQRLGTAKAGRSTTKPRIATINPILRQPAPLTDQTQDSTAKSNHKFSRRTPTTTATLHARQMHLAHTTQTHQGHRQSPPSRQNPVHVAGGLCYTTTQIPPATGNGTSGSPLTGVSPPRGTGCQR